MNLIKLKIDSSYQLKKLEDLNPLNFISSFEFCTQSRKEKRKDLKVCASLVNNTTDLIPETLLCIKGWTRNQPIAFFNSFMEGLCNKLINNRDFMRPARCGR